MWLGKMKTNLARLQKHKNNENRICQNMQLKSVSIKNSDFPSNQIVAIEHNLVHLLPVSDIKYHLRLRFIMYTWLNSGSIAFLGGQGFRFYSRLVGRSDPWSKKWWVIFWNDGPKHIKLTIVDSWVVYFTYTLTQTLVYIYVYWLLIIL